MGKESTKKKKKEEKKKKSKRDKEEENEEEDEWAEVSDSKIEEKVSQPEILRESWMLKPEKKKEDVEVVNNTINEAESETKKFSKHEINPETYVTNVKSTALPRIIENRKREANSWKIMKVNKVFEISEKTNRPLNEVILERYLSIEEFEADLKEKDLISGTKTNLDKMRSNKKFGLNFLNPDQQEIDRVENIIKFNKEKKNLKNTTINIPSTESLKRSHSHCLTPDELNKLKSSVLKAKLMGAKNAKELEKNYEYEVARAEEEEKVIVVDEKNKKISKYDKKKKQKVEEFDNFGKRIKYADENDEITLEEMVMQEKVNQSNGEYDKNFANSISRDARFDNNLDYIEDQADNLTRNFKDKKNDRLNSLNALNNKSKINPKSQCQFCFEDEKSSNFSVVAVGVRTYLALPQITDLVPGHCYIIPTNHCISSLELEDDVWDEIRNFKKCLIRMFAAENKGVVFMEQVVNLKWEKHTFIECIPLPAEHFEVAPQFFKEALKGAGEEWSQYRKIIDTSKRGFRKSLVKNLPYFHVWFDPNNGFGQVIEEPDSWPQWFGKEIIGGMLDLGTELWRKPKYLNNKSEIDARLTKFKSKFKPFDWTSQLI
ncbi:hypothetical protein HDU92_006061 [Lobulomyces angularis]|nr:hypothetical protein HDU92_006061 [Lobulomyces angularis]